MNDKAILQATKRFFRELGGTRCAAQARWVVGCIGPGSDELAFALVEAVAGPGARALGQLLALLEALDTPLIRAGIALCRGAVAIGLNFCDLGFMDANDVAELMGVPECAALLGELSLWHLSISIALLLTPLLGAATDHAAPRLAHPKRQRRPISEGPISEGRRRSSHRSRATGNSAARLGGSTASHRVSRVGFGSAKDPLYVRGGSLKGACLHASPVQASSSEDTHLQVTEVSFDAIRILGTEHVHDDRKTHPGRLGPVHP